MLKWMAVTEMFCGNTEVSLYDDASNRVLLTDLSPVDSIIITELINNSELVETNTELEFPMAEGRIYIF